MSDEWLDAAKKGDVARLKALLDGGANINAKGGRRHTAAVLRGPWSVPRLPPPGRHSQTAAPAAPLTQSAPCAPLDDVRCCSAHPLPPTPTHTPTESQHRYWSNQVLRRV